ncbi:hypothetical protein EMPS_10583 [Entomortierella parvispora]|uniref:RING-type domain-containing protein n=1 Tax=Entomortierella parvispora TaxID=205924 RepID=A0A9P3HK59_9FUNG|nr:hypothetical protein EMPS_10583 [Entomortierella parvispora]
MSSGLDLVSPSYIMSFRSRRRRRRTPSSSHSPPSTSSTASPSSSPVVGSSYAFTSSRALWPTLSSHVQIQTSDYSLLHTSIPTTAPLDLLERTLHPILSTPQVTLDTYGNCPVSWSVFTSEPVAVSDLNRLLGTSGRRTDLENNPIASVSRVLNGSSFGEATVDSHHRAYLLDSISLPEAQRRTPLGSNSATNISSSESSSCSAVAHGTGGGREEGGEQCGPSAETGSPRSSGRPTSFELSKQTLLTEADNLDCAICLDTIHPRKHAKATLACRHEFHLSCISMAFAMGKEMVCPLCRYLHKDQPFMSLESEDDAKLSPVSQSLLGASASLVTHIGPSFHRHGSHRRSGGLDLVPNTQHEHPTSGTVLSMMPSLFETTLGRGPSAGTVQTSPDGICLRTSTWLMLYAMPFTVALCFLGFVLGKVETMWSKISCLIGAAICYMVCWALVVAVMDPDHEARAIVMQRQSLEGQNQAQHPEMQQQQQQQPLAPLHDPATAEATAAITGMTTGTTEAVAPTSTSAAVAMATATVMDTGAAWTRGWFVRNLRARVVDLADMLEEIPDMMGEW